VLPLAGFRVTKVQERNMIYAIRFTPLLKTMHRLLDGAGASD
jgi:hypothetical protein